MGPVLCPVETSRSPEVGTSRSLEVGTTSEDTFTMVLYVKYVVLYAVIFLIKTWFSHTLICSNLLRFFFNCVFLPRYTST